MLRVILAFGVTCVATTASAQVVQLPTFYRFGTTGSVVVPDQGSAALGSTATSQNGYAARRVGGFGGPTALGASGQLRFSGVRAWIIDHAAIDAALLAAPTDPRKKPMPAAPSLGSLLQQHQQQRAGTYRP